MKPDDRYNLRFELNRFHYELGYTLEDIDLEYREWEKDQLNPRHIEGKCPYCSMPIIIVRGDES